MLEITGLLNQSVVWKAVASTDDRDDPAYASPVTLSCRKVQRLKDLIGKDGEVTTATNQITLAANSTVAIGDLLDGREVVALVDMVTIQGQSVGHMALTR